MTVLSATACACHADVQPTQPILPGTAPNAAPDVTTHIDDAIRRLRDSLAPGEHVAVYVQQIGSSVDARRTANALRERVAQIDGVVLSAVSDGVSIPIPGGGEALADGVPVPEPDVVIQVDDDASVVATRHRRGVAPTSDGSGEVAVDQVTTIFEIRSHTR